METLPQQNGREGRDDPLFEALTAPRSSSFVDALFALSGETVAQNAGEPGRALTDGFQKALARKMQAILMARERRDAA